ncbi:uncharacterized protein [Ptychodera flava]|uniref:uncharacterized protein n=1 Tax=Ptychodera flava TaxID=63121 RepID=UPI00396A9017
MECCGDECLGELSKNAIKDAEREFKEIGNEDRQRQFILNKIIEHSTLKVVNGKKVVTTNLVIKGVPVCNSAWCHVLNISAKRFASVVHLYKENIITIKRGNSGRMRMTEKTTVCLTWMQFLFERIGDYMPHKTEVHLPPSWTKDRLYNRMVSELLERKYGRNMIISRGHFQRIWAQHLPEFKIMKGKQDFPVCTTCVNLREELVKAKKAEDRTRITKLIERHDEQVSIERKQYHNAREKARTHPEEMTTVIIDGMDQSKTNVPHFVVKDKDTHGLLQVLTHITGSLHHTDVPHGKVPYVFLDLRQFPHDSNLTMNVLLQMLLKKKEALGKTLYTQLDNCYRENKNRYVLCLGSLLVEYGVFDEKYVAHSVKQRKVLEELYQ